MADDKKLDNLDLKILSALQANARVTNQSLAEQVALSPSSCLQRVRRLEQDGYLQSYHATLDLASISRHISCIATVIIKDHNQKDFADFEAMVQEIPEIVECYTVSGEFDFFLRVICPDMAHYLAINDRLVRSGDYSVSINTHVIMKDNKTFKGVELKTLL
ncbi:MAG: Lrp/AsnC family transcriptional regulator of ectoine degradation [Pseudohongiellaceae bacterium]|jgi:Lrp/AsnC family transcriptional regulator of ectoine degradation